MHDEVRSVLAVLVVGGSEHLELTGLARLGVGSLILRSENEACPGLPATRILSYNSVES